MGRYVMQNITECCYKSLQVSASCAAAIEAENENEPKAEVATEEEEDAIVVEEHDVTSTDMFADLLRDI